MKRGMFRVLNETEKRAKLLLVLAKKSEGKLSNTELEQVVNNLSIDCQYKIKVITSAKEFAKECTLSNSILEHSSAGDSGDIDKATVLAGDGIEFGEEYYYEYFNNGNSDGGTSRSKVPNFDTGCKYVISKESHSYSSFNNDNYDNYKYTIVVYLPSEVPYVVSKEVKYILDNFNIKQ